ncbi:MAG TPA: VanW family protein [Candidatus Udaeobacter sp.]|nr:VanW family protein [Candidatus Udaeobacter sp.]
MSLDELKSLNLAEPKTYRKRNFLIGLGIFLAALILANAGAWAYYNFYKDKIIPGVYVGQHSLEGMTFIQAKDFIENFNNRLAKESLGFNFIVPAKYDESGVPSSTDGSKTENFKLTTISADDSSVELVKVNSETSAAKLVAIGKSGGFWQKLWQPLYIRLISPQQVSADVVVEDRFISNLQNYLLPFSDQPHNANIKITGLTPLAYTIVPEHEGTMFDYDRLKNDLLNNLAGMSLAPIKVYNKNFKPDVFVPDLDSVIKKLPDILNYGDLSLNYIDPQTKVRRDWSIGSAIYRSWFEVRREDGNPVLALNREKVAAYLDGLRPFIDMPTQDAKFVMENNRVKEFQASQTGLRLDADKTFADLDTVFRQRNFNPAEVSKTVTVSVDIVKPNVAMADANNLGIMDVMGVGYSTFKDSHTNRIKNIANAVKRLNGILIQPGEEFSANKYAGPYIAEEGFLPEMVIKGDEIKPEVGGGMCQIGTTLFRMAMNSGMPITERRNHSLVVGYYADPINGNPGTDATLYEPSVDFKFKNDTGGYLLLQTNIDYAKQQLTFTLWGKSDGRSGSYTHPVVNKWIPAGDQKDIVVPPNNELKAGETKCQGAFRGAVTSFTYTRFTSSSQKIEQVFDSYYRPLSKICMTAATTTSGLGIPLDLGEGQ